MQWWQFRSTPMRSVILAKVSVLKIAWEAWRFARGDDSAIARRQRAVVAVNTCSANPTDTAVNIANQIAAKVRT
jgi:hypothetical protein